MRNSRCSRRWSENTEPSVLMCRAAPSRLTSQLPSGRPLREFSNATVRYAGVAPAILWFAVHALSRIRTAGKVIRYFVLAASVLADGRQERIAIRLELARADPRDLAQLAQRHGPGCSHLAQRRVVEDHVGRHLRLGREFAPQRTQRFEQRIADRVGRAVAPPAFLARRRRPDDLDRLLALEDRARIAAELEPAVLGRQ